jgi:prolyl-tRNA synthetase
MGGAWREAERPAAGSASRTGFSQDARQSAWRDNTVSADSLDEIREILSDATRRAEKGGGKFVMAHVKDDPACDAKLKELKASVRCTPLEDHFGGEGPCIFTGETVAKRSVISKGY